MVPVPKKQGISNGYLRPSDGIVALGAGGPGIDRASINWEDVCYRVMGTKLVSVDADGLVTTIGDVEGTTQATLDYSFDLLATASNEKLFYLDKDGLLTEVTDPDLGIVLDVIWVDGFFMTTDGENLVVVDLDDPTNVNPLKYGSSEVDPDRVVALEKLRNEPVALNRYTIEFFDNIGGNFFPFQRIDGAQITKGCIGTHACAIYNDAVAFLGSGRREAPSVYLGNNGSVAKISTREIDQVLLEFTEEELADTVFEVKVDSGFNHLHIRLPDRTIVYGINSSSETGQPVWFNLSSAIDGFSQNRASNMVWCYDKWIVGDPQSSALGVLSDSASEHWGEEIGWEFSTGILYNQSNNAIVHELELVALTGRTALDKDPTIRTDYSTDGVTYSNPKFIKAGKQGERNKRLAWRRQGFFRNWRVQRFKGTSDTHLSFARLEANIEPLAF